MCHCVSNIFFAIVFAIALSEPKQRATTKLAPQTITSKQQECRRILHHQSNKKCTCTKATKTQTICHSLRLVCVHAHARVCVCVFVANAESTKNYDGFLCGGNRFIWSANVGEGFKVIISQWHFKCKCCTIYVASSGNLHTQKYIPQFTAQHLRLICVVNKSNLIVYSMPSTGHKTNRHNCFRMWDDKSVCWTMLSASLGKVLQYKLISWATATQDNPFCTLQNDKVQFILYHYSLI